MSYEISGKLIDKQEVIQISDKFRKCEFVLEKRNENDFTDYVKFQLTQDRTNLIKRFNIGDILTVSFVIRGNRWEKEGKVSYFTNLEALKIEKFGEEPEISVAEAPPPEESSLPDDDLPF
jgi:hypothetical protein